MDSNNQNKNIISIILCIMNSVFKQWRTIILLGCFFAISFDVVSTITYSPLYSASAVCAIVDTDDKGLKSENASKASQSILYLLNSQYIKDKVNINLDQDDFDGNIYINMTNDTNFCTITVQASSQKDAYFELTQLISIYQSLSKSLSFGYNLNIVEDIEFTNMPLNYNSHSKNYKDGFIFGIVTITLVIMFINYFKDTIKSENDINDKIDVRLFAKIPKEIKKYQKWGFLTKNKTAILVSQFKTGFTYVEAMNKLASKVEELSRKHKYQTLLITSSLENEGKSSVAVNLAISLAKNKKKVLIIDSDLRKPSLHKIFEHHFQFGFSDILHNHINWKKAIVSLEKEHIDVIFTKVDEDSQELLSHYDLLSLLNEMKKEYDYVIVDSSPSRYIVDTSYIVSSCDATFMVVKQDSATCKVINDTIYQLSNASANIVGTIYNGSVYNPLKSHSAYGYRYGYYRYHRERKS